VFLTSVLDGGEWPASRSGGFNLAGRAANTIWTGGWLGPRAGLDAMAKRNIPVSVGNRTPVVQPVA